MAERDHGLDGAHAAIIRACALRLDLSIKAAPELDARTCKVWNLCTIARQGSGLRWLREPCMGAIADKLEIGAGDCAPRGEREHVPHVA
jgi:hypothetical protein